MKRFSMSVVVAFGATVLVAPFLCAAKPAKDVKIGLQDAAWTCDEASAVADFSGGLGLVYWCQWKDPEVRKRKKTASGSFDSA